jgi:hypothetical protein
MRKDTSLPKIKQQTTNLSKSFSKESVSSSSKHRGLDKLPHAKGAKSTKYHVDSNGELRKFKNGSLMKIINDSSSKEAL